MGLKICPLQSKKSNCKFVKLNFVNFPDFVSKREDWVLLIAAVIVNLETISAFDLTTSVIRQQGT